MVVRMFNFWIFQKKIKGGKKVWNIPSGNLPQENEYKYLVLDWSVFHKLQVESYQAQWDYSLSTTITWGVSAYSRAQWIIFFFLDSVRLYCILCSWLFWSLNLCFLIESKIWNQLKLSYSCHYPGSQELGSYLNFNVSDWGEVSTCFLGLVMLSLSSWCLQTVNSSHK